MLQYFSSWNTFSFLHFMLRIYFHIFQKIQLLRPKVLTEFSRWKLVLLQWKICIHSLFEVFKLLSSLYFRKITISEKVAFSKISYLTLYQRIRQPYPLFCGIKPCQNYYDGLSLSQRTGWANPLFLSSWQSNLSPYTYVVARSSLCPISVVLFTT